MIERKSEGAFFSRRRADADTQRKVANWAHWDCNDKMFDYEYDRTVSFYVKSGQASLIFSNGERLDIQSGDIITVYQGAKIHWQIQAPIQNLYCYHDSFDSANLRHQHVYYRD